MTSELRRGFCVDRVLVVGMSAGAMMSHRWACEGTQVDAFVPVAGTLEVDTCEGEPVPVRMVHGTEDGIVPYGGGRGDGRLALTEFSGAEWTAEQWRVRNQCTDAEPTVETNGSVTCQAWDCAASTILCTIEGGPHEWPANIHLGQDSWSWFLDQAPEDPGEE